jgi:hypothetical protein
LAAEAAGAQPNDLIERMIASGVVEKRTPGGYPVLRFSLDPAAEYLAAIRRLFKMRGSSREQWQTHLGELAQTDGYPQGPEGYLVAFATSYRAYRRDFSLPEMVFPWEQNV